MFACRRPQADDVGCLREAEYRTQAKGCEACDRSYTVGDHDFFDFSGATVAGRAKGSPLLLTTESEE
jgi:hypothetical protein